MATPAATSAYSVIYIGTLEKTTGNNQLANKALGDDSQTSLVTNTSGRQFFQPLFDPNSFTNDPVEGNRKQSFTFWRTDYLDRSFANSAIGAIDQGSNQGSLGDEAGTNGLKPDAGVTWIQVGMNNPSMGNTDWREFNDDTITVRINPLVTQVKRMRAAYNFACAVYGPEFTVNPEATGEDNNDINVGRWGPLNLRNYGYSTVVNSNGTTLGKGVYPGFRCGI